MTMTLHKLFGGVEGPQTRSIRMKVIRPVWETLTINEVASDYIGGRSRFTSSREVFELFNFMKNETKEHFLAIHLDSKNRTLCLDHISSGSLNASIVHPREVFKGCLLSSAAAVLFLHNHPSGDPDPSREDLELTTRLKEAGELLGIRVLDHIVIGSGRYISLADQGLV
jgi:DNA repair protein RadC